MNSMPTTYQVSDQRGFSLIEVLLSMVLLVLVSTVVIAMGSGTLVNAFSNQDRTRALSYTQEAVEQLRAIRDTDPQRIFIDPASDLWCPPSPPTSYYYFSLEGDLIDYYCGIPDPNDPGQGDRRFQPFHGWNGRKVRAPQDAVLRNAESR